MHELTPLAIRTIALHVELFASLAFECVCTVFGGQFEVAVSIPALRGVRTPALLTVVLTKFSFVIWHYIPESTLY